MTLTLILLRLATLITWIILILFILFIVAMFMMIISGNKEERSAGVIGITWLSFIMIVIVPLLSWILTGRFIILYEITMDLLSANY